MDRTLLTTETASLYVRYQRDLGVSAADAKLLVADRDMAAIQRDPRVREVYLGV